MGPPCKQRSQAENWSYPQESVYNGDGSNESTTVANRWDPVVWYEQHGYNVTEMIKAPANLTSRGLVRTSGTLVRAEELGIVLVVLSLWAAAIGLFINRWGKIRLMEPYHPYIETPAPTVVATAAPSSCISARPSISHQGRNSLLIPGVSRERRPSLLCVLEQHARRQSTLSLLSADYGMANPSRRMSTSSRALLQAPFMTSSCSNAASYLPHHDGIRVENTNSRRHSQSTVCQSKTANSRMPAAFLVANCFQDRNRIHRNSLSIMSPSNHRSRSFDGRDIYFQDDESRRHSVSSCSKLLADSLRWRKSSDEGIIYSQKRSSLDVNVIGRRQIIIPDIRTEQVGELTEPPKLLLSSATPEQEAAVISHHIIDNEAALLSERPESPVSSSRPKRPKDWKCQAAFELSSSLSCESEASFIVNEFLHKTSPPKDFEEKLESYV